VMPRSAMRQPSAQRDQLAQARQLEARRLQHTSDLSSDLGEILILGLGVLAVMGTVGLGAWLVWEFFRTNQHVAVVQHAWAAMRTSLQSAADATASSYQTERVKKLLQEAERRDTKLVMFSHSHAGVVMSSVIRQLVQQQQLHLLDRWIVVGIGNPNHIAHVPGSRVRVHQYRTHPDIVADMYITAGQMRAHSLRPLQSRLLNAQTHALGWHMADVYLSLLLLDR